MLYHLYEIILQLFSTFNELIIKKVLNIFSNSSSLKEAISYLKYAYDIFYKNIKIYL
jgi:hypothetical protein